MKVTYKILVIFSDFVILLL